jgi:hypothetical protein
MTEKFVQKEAGIATVTEKWTRSVIGLILLIDVTGIETIESGTTMIESVTSIVIGIEEKITRGARKRKKKGTGIGTGIEGRGTKREMGIEKEKEIRSEKGTRSEIENEIVGVRSGNIEIMDVNDQARDPSTLIMVLVNATMMKKRCVCRILCRCSNGNSYTCSGLPT